MADTSIPFASILGAQDPQDAQGVPLATLAQMIRSGLLSRQPVEQFGTGLEQFGTAAGNLFAPAVTDYLRNGPSPDTAQSLVPNAAGKLPSTDPRLTKAVQEAGNIAATAPMLAAAPEASAALRAVAPEVAGRVAGAMPQVSERAIADIAGGAAGMPSMSTPAYAGERPTINPEEQKQLDGLDTQINQITAERAAAIKKVPRSRGEWDQNRFNTAVQAAGAPYDQRMQQISGQKTAIQNSILQRGVTYDQQQAAATAAQQPIAVRNGPALMAARAIALGTSPLLGGLLGYKGFSPMKQIAGGMVEGALPNIGANTIDYATGGAAKEQALKNFTDPDWWKYAVGMESGLAGAGAVTGGHVGEAIRTPTPRGEPRPNVPLPGGQPSAASPLAQAIVTGQSGGKVWPGRWQDIDMKKDSAGNWYEVGTGHKIPARLYPPANAKSNRP